MKLDKHDIGKYYLVQDDFSTLGIKNICKFVELLSCANHYPYKMYSIKGHWEGV